MNIGEVYMTKHICGISCQTLQVACQRHLSICCPSKLEQADMATYRGKGHFSNFRFVCLFLLLLTEKQVTKHSIWFKLGVAQFRTHTRPALVRFDGEGCFFCCIVIALVIKLAKSIMSPQYSTSETIMEMDNGPMTPQQMLQHRDCCSIWTEKGCSTYAPYSNKLGLYKSYTNIWWPSIH